MMAAAGSHWRIRLRATDVISLLRSLLHESLLPSGPELLASFSSARKVKRAGRMPNSYEEQIMGKKLYVGNLSYDVDSSALEQLFAPHGSVQSAQIITDRDTGRSKGLGFGEMSSAAEPQAAIAATNGQDSGGRAMTVNEAKPREERP